MKIAIASDHGGYELKENIKKYLESSGDAVASGKVDRGIVCCGTGIGISIAANKVKGIRCALCTDTYMAEMSRRHNDSNILALGGRTTGVDKALRITKAWIDTEFEGGRHQRRKTSAERSRCMKTEVSKNLQNKEWVSSWQG